MRRSCEMDRLLLCSLLIILSVLCQTSCALYNEKNIIELYPSPGGDNRSYFGYSVLMREGRFPKVIIGAPNDRSLHYNHRNIANPGAIYVCNIGQDSKKVACDQHVLDTDGNSKRRLGNGRSYHHRKDNMWLGMTMDGNTNNNASIVICAPRWANQFHNDYYLGNGLCYTISETENLPNARHFSLMPLVSQDNQGFLVQPEGEPSRSSYFYAYGQAGISVKLTRDQSELIIGAPGVFDWTGTIIRYKISKAYPYGEYFSLKNVPNPYYTSQLHLNDYFGYSVDSGIFVSDKQELYVAGAPRGFHFKGQVFIFDFPLRDTQSYSIYSQFEGSQLGEYYGSVILAIDINGDGLSDLIVGAPLFAQPLSFDQGRVEVIMNYDMFKFEKQEALIAGKLVNGARFGSAISSLGDVNNDGYFDVAIGAPYENDGRGAVYIYVGTSVGLHPKFVQRITAEGAQGFGISISKGVDIDKNLCNDIVVGAYNSASAYLFRCSVQIGVIVSLESRPEEIDESTKEIELVFCFLFQAREKLFLRLELSGSILVDPQYKRARLRNSTEKYFVVNNGGSNYKCQAAMIDINEVETTDFSRPIEVEIKYSNKNDPNNIVPFCESCAILPLFDPMQKSLRIPFATGCGNNSVCKPDLKLTLNSSVGTTYVIGSTPSMQLNVSVFNIGQPAFLPIVRIPIDENIPLLKVPTQCHIEKDFLVCNLENPLKTNAESFILIEFNTKLLTSRDSLIKFNATISSGGEELTPDDNNKILNILLVTQYKLNIIGQTLDSGYHFVEPETTSNLSLSHAYEITNEGPTAVNYLFLEVLIPFVLHTDTSEKLSLVDAFEVKTSLNSQPLVCAPNNGIYNAHKLEGHGFDITNEDNNENSSEVSYIVVDETNLPNLTRSKRSTFAIGDEMNLFDTWNITLPVDTISKELDYKFIKNDITYQIVRCSGPGLSVSLKERALVFTKLKLNVTNIAKVLKNERSLLLGTSVSARGLRDLTEPDVKLWTTSYIIGKSSSSSAPPLWIIILSIILGVILLALITYILYKVGFFRRRTQEDLEHLKSHNIDRSDETDPEASD